MSTNVKVGFALAALVASVFVGTLIFRAAPEDPKADTKTGGDPAAAGPVELLRYDFAHIYYDPNNERAAFREYDGFFEKGEHQAHLWFSNPNPVPVKMTFLQTSCNACKYADIAVLPTPRVAAAVADPDPFTAALGGHAPVSLDAAEHAERERMVADPKREWHRLTARDATTAFEFPPAAAPGRPTWGVIRLNINVTETKLFIATIGLQKPDMKSPVPVEFKATVALAPMCEVFPTEVNFGTLAETTPAVSETLYYFSCTRTNGGGPDTQLPKPLLQGVKGDPFLTFSAAEPLTAADRAELAAQLLARRKAPFRVTGGYKVKMTLSRSAPDPEAPTKARDIDIGAAERVVVVAPESGSIETTPKVLVKCVAAGPVSLEQGSAIELGNFQIKTGVSRTVRVYSERPGLDLEAAPELNKPSYLQLLPLSDPETKDGRTSWALRVKVGPNEGSGVLDAGSSVVLRIKSTGQLIRLPVTGRGSSS